VAGFVLGATAFWVAIENIVFARKKRVNTLSGKPPPPGA
jgi:hypothetical protein